MHSGSAASLGTIKDILTENNIIIAQEGEIEEDIVYNTLLAQEDLESVFFDIFGVLVQRLSYFSETTKIRKILQRIVQTCNVKEVFLVLTEALSSFSHTQKSLCVDNILFLFELLKTVLLRIKARRGHFIDTALSLVIQIFDNLVKGDSDEEEEKDDEAANHHPTASLQILGEEQGKEKEKDDDVISRVLLVIINMLSELTNYIATYEGSDVEVQKNKLLLYLFVLLSKPIVITRNHYTEPAAIMAIIKTLGINITSLLEYSEHTVPGNLRNGQARDDSDGDSDDDSDDDSVPKKQHPVVLPRDYPYYGLGFFFYLLLVKQQGQELWPEVLSPTYTFNHVIPYVSGLLLHPTQQTSTIALELLDIVLRNMTNHTLATRECVAPQDWIMIRHLDSSSIVNHHLFFFQALLNWLSQCPHEKLRNHGVMLLKRTMALFLAKSRFEIFGALYKTSPFPQVSTLLIHMIKEEVDRSYYGNTDDDPDSPSFFAGPKLLTSLLPILMHNNGDVMNEMDKIIAALNFYRYLLIKDRSRKIIGVCSRSHTVAIKQNVITPLQDRTRDLLRDFQSLEKDDPESLRKHEETAELLGLEKLTPEESRQSAALATTSLLLLNDLLSRVDELIDANNEE